MCQVGLQFGADDVGSILIEENVVFAAGVRNRTNEGELRRIIEDAGYRCRRAARYAVSLLFIEIVPREFVHSIVSILVIPSEAE